MMKKYLCFIFIFYLAGNLCAQNNSFPKNMFIGLGPEINGYTRSGFGLGGSLQLGFDLNDNFSFGQKTAFISNFDAIRVIEIQLFARYNFPWLNFPSKEDGPFVQAEAGTALIMEHGYHIYDEVFPHFAGGIALGWKFNFPSRWYIEPALRAGYPYIWGAGITAGIKFKVTGNREQVKENSEQLAISNEQIEVESHRINMNIFELEEDNREQIESAPVDVPWLVLSFENDKGIEEHLLAVREDNNRLRIQTPFVVFRENHADFTGLNAHLLDSNENTFKRVAQMLDSYKDFNILIEGHANPTTPEGLERESEEPILKRLSEERARAAADELIRFGIDQNRLTVAGFGSAKTIIPYNDFSNSWKNRKVEFILISEQ